MLFAFPLDSGRTVYVESISISDIYEGLLTGRPTAAFNDYLIEEITKTAGNLKSHVIQPAIDGSTPGHPVLPRVCFSVKVWSGPLPGSDKSSSGLHVVWFATKFPELPLNIEVKNQIGGLPWNDIAASFEW